ncbi:Hypothetical protein GbCGDNIH2_1592 [Granulibacter bethesdensis]|uniref:Uncharacterized protein n=1 Tax=Granulibacter bethesdensis TaxID=364410 RepID=A0AAN0VGG0_9PROT|nr:Hypothetical protein GbCGDNIH3_1592 [Granulibacter bethesdensis]AHJ65939.1 Hypothetical protein GbCGDNIH4_1592 [Granulibacter bethesdensis CGDNIH4]AHJ68568.1 Hypothetical protein GbCGDNIH2_1592 [Granulibacter bethesdensis]APH59936.1 Hypothetical protein GbCGDNIH7_1592 [Granulibacter bethesdensis]
MPRMVESQSPPASSPASLSADAEGKAGLPPRRCLYCGVLFPRSAEDRFIFRCPEHRVMED